MTEERYTRELQQKLDIEKWLGSEEASRDLCGSYIYCPYCNKAEDAPCANAYIRMVESEKAAAQNDALEEADAAVADAAEDAAADEAEADTLVALGKTVDVEDVMKRKAARKSLSLTTTPKGTPKIKSRISRQCDTYRRNGDIVAKITIIGGSLRINLPLDPDAPEFNDGKMPHTATGHKKVYAEVPFQFKVNSKLALKRALRLIEMVK